MNLPPPTERQARILWFALTGLAMAVLAGLAGGVIWVLGRVLTLFSHVLWPLAVAGILACLLNPVVGFLERRTRSRPRAILSVFCLAILLVASLGVALLPQLITEGQDLAARIPSYASRLEARATEWWKHPPAYVAQIHNLLSSRSGHLPEPEPGGTNPATGLHPAPPPGPTPAPAPGAPVGQEQYRAAAGWVARALPDAGAWLLEQLKRVASWFGVLAGIGLIPVYTFYFLLEQKGIAARWTDYLPVKDSAFKEELVFVISSVNNHLVAFFRGQVLVALCNGTVYAIGFLLVGLPYAALIGVAAMILTIIPYLGSLVVVATSLLIAVVQFGDWLHPLLVLGVFATVQTLESLVLAPRIIGKSVGLHPLAIIVAVLAGTTLLGGVLGGLLAIPLTAALRVLMFRYFWQKHAIASAAPSPPPTTARPKR